MRMLLWKTKRVKRMLRAGRTSDGEVNETALTSSLLVRLEIGICL